MFAITMIDKDNQLILFPSPGASFDPSYFPDTAFWSTFAKWVLKYLEMFVTDKYATGEQKSKIPFILRREG